MSSITKVWPYGTVVIDNDGEVVMLLGFSPDGGEHNAGLRLYWPGGYTSLIELREIISDFINMGDRHRVQE